MHVCFVKLMNLFLPEGKKLNPLIGNAGVSVITMLNICPMMNSHTGVCILMILSLTVRNDISKKVAV